MLDLATWTDVSRFNNSYPANDTIYPIDFAKMQDQGVEGVCIRKTIGRFHDPTFEMNWRGAGDVGLQRTVYCVPYVAYALTKQKQVVEEWPSGGKFDGRLDIPAWGDIERKHKLLLSVAIERALDYLYFMVDTFDRGTEIYTAKYVWQDFYSKKPGWQQEWGLVVAFYRKDLYYKSVAEVKQMVAEQRIHPSVPTGWFKDMDGNTLPSELRWEHWQIFADGDNLGPTYGCPSRDIDISFRQGRLPPSVPGSDLKQKVLELREQFGVMNDTLVEVEELVNA